MILHKDARQPSKKEAYSILKVAKLGQRPLTPAEFDSLLLYFTDSPGKVAKTALEWVAKAADIGGPKSVRPHFACVFVRGGVAMATDGHRLHTAAVDLPDGNYCPKTGALLPRDHIAGDSNPPDGWARLIDRGEGVPRDVDLAKWAKVIGTGAAAGITYLKHPAARGGINAKYAADATNGSKNQIAYCHEQEAYYGSNEHGEWAVMGMRLNKP